MLKFQILFRPPLPPPGPLSPPLAWHELPLGQDLLSLKSQTGVGQLSES